MNVLDASMKLYEWFGKKDSFVMKTDFIKVMLVTESPERDRAAFLCALDSLEKYEIVQSSILNLDTSEEKKVWTLRRPLESMPQNIELSHDLTGMIATVVNEFSTMIDRKESYCDPSQINPDNIRDLVFITNYFMNPPPDDKNIDKFPPDTYTH